MSKQRHTRAEQDKTRNIRDVNHVRFYYSVLTFVITYIQSCIVVFVTDESCSKPWIALSACPGCFFFFITKRLTTEICVWLFADHHGASFNYSWYLYRFIIYRFSYRKLNFFYRYRFIVYRLPQGGF